MWTHLERIVGGSPGGVGTGPEQQLEIDRRLVQQRKSHLKRANFGHPARKTRSVEKRNVDSFTVGLVGQPTPAARSSTLTEGARTQTTASSPRS